MYFMRGEVEHCAGCGSYFCWECEGGTFECPNCEESYCSDCTKTCVMENGWCRDCFEHCCLECGAAYGQCRHSYTRRDEEETE